ncbi:hypothetical protein MJT46_011856 [Ovis ammon polii x Ovis aries]|nr:hypothetical protein MJT46_011856 [Ovis ammon polii x Ovis aries]
MSLPGGGPGPRTPLFQEPVVTGSGLGVPKSGLAGQDNRDPEGTVLIPKKLRVQEQRHVNVPELQLGLGQPLTREPEGESQPQHIAALALEKEEQRLSWQMGNASPRFKACWGGCLPGTDGVGHGLPQAQYHCLRTDAGALILGSVATKAFSQPISPVPIHTMQQGFVTKPGPRSKPLICPSKRLRQIPPQYTDSRRDNVLERNKLESDPVRVR